MGTFTLILLGFVLGLITQHVIIVMSEAARGLCSKVQGIKRVELDFHDDEDRPKLGK